jgi:hypothetical protein
MQRLKFIINFTLKIKFNMRNDGHFKSFSKKDSIFEWNVLGSTMFQVSVEKSMNTNWKNEFLKKIFIFFL